MLSKKSEVWLIVPLFGLTLFGFFNILGIRPDLISRYILFAVIGWILFFFIKKLPVTLIEQNYKSLYVLFILLFIATIIFGDDIRGSKRWIDLYIFRFQTSEFFKPVFIITMASVLSSVNRFTPRKLVISILLFIIPFMFIFKQPDLGSSLVFAGTFLVMLYYSGVSTQIFVRLGILGAMIMPFGWLFLKEYQKARIIGFINPEIDPQGLTYNITQSIISVGSGGFFGKGLGLGTQTRFKFLPEFHTDFAFASLIEQFGFLGGLILLIILFGILTRIVKKILSSKENEFAYLYLIGAFTILVVEITINIGMNLGLMPVTGIALPFISYGGSSVLSTMIILGIVAAL